MKGKEELKRIQWQLDKKKWLIFLGVILLAILVIWAVVRESKHDEDTFFHLSTDGLGASIYQKSTQQDIKLLADAGFKWARVDMTWSRIEETRGEYDFVNSGYDKLNEQMMDEGIQPYYMLGYGNPLYEVSQITTDESRKAFINFVDSVTTRYKNQGNVWEIWNEANIKYWKAQPSYKDYSRLVNEVAPIIKENDPGSKVVAPAVSGLNEESFKWLEQLFKRGILQNIDAISVHPYRGEKPESVENDYKKLHELIKKYTSKDITIVCGEWGYATEYSQNFQDDDNERKQAEYLVRMFLINISNNIPMTIWYNLKNNGNEFQKRIDNYGVVTSDGQPKISYLAVQTLTNQLKGYEFSKDLTYGKQGNYILEFKNSKKEKILVYWTTKDNSDLRLRIDSGKGKVVSMLGSIQRVQWKNKIHLNLSSSPNYLIID
ncbi:cellulase family glycosylhydrolase [Priestia aryabhattai]|uniref:cellulase family glycosylhydrolase n=1 Tax=Priestia TaxID=2800373 RepID=UPI00336B27E4